MLGHSLLSPRDKQLVVQHGRAKSPLAFVGARAPLFVQAPGSLPKPLLESKQNHSLPDAQGLGTQRSLLKRMAEEISTEGNKRCH